MKVPSTFRLPHKDLGALYDTLTLCRATQAARLDRQADIELQHGHHRVAERLALLAAELRETRSGAEARR